MLPVAYGRGTFHFKVTWIYNTIRGQGKRLALVTHLGDLHISVPVLYSAFVSVSLQIQARICFHSKIEILGVGVFCVSACWAWYLDWKCLGPSPGPWLLVASPPRISPTRAHVVADPGLVVLSNSQQGILKKQVHYSQVLEGIQHVEGPHSAVMERERDHGVLPSLDPRVGGLGFWGFALYWWIENT